MEKHSHQPEDHPFPVELIEQMVDQFYSRIRKDAVLGPIFSKRIHDWSTHLGRMVLFWRAVLRSERVFAASPRGGPPILHRQIEELSQEHFTRWLRLFGEVADALYPPPAAKHVKASAARIGAALSQHLGPRERPNATPLSTQRM